MEENTLEELSTPLIDSSAVDASESDLTRSKDAAIANILEVCAENKIEINENLRRAVLGETLYSEAECKSIRRETFAKRVSILGALVHSHQEEIKTSIKETQLAQEIRAKLEGISLMQSSFEVRIKNGSYTVQAPVTAGGQHIETVGNTGFLTKVSS